MNGGRPEETSDCYFHPLQTVVGVCPLCLHEKLIFLASRQSYFSSPRTFNLRSPAPSSISLSKIFAFTGFLHRLEFRQATPESADLNASTSSDDSFISIKFEENGVGSWEKNEKTSKENNEARKSTAVLRWRNPIEELFQVIRSRRSSKASTCHVGNMTGGVKLRRGWMRSRRKTRTMAG